jgi:hypothetical protein
VRCLWGGPEVGKHLQFPTRPAAYVASWLNFWQNISQQTQKNIFFAEKN